MHSSLLTNVLHHAGVLSVVPRHEHILTLYLTIIYTVVVPVKEWKVSNIAFNIIVIIIIKTV